MRTIFKIGTVTFVLALLLGLIAIVTPFMINVSMRGYIVGKVEDVQAQPVAVVFGAGLRRNGMPSDVLRDRLIVASQLYDAKKVSKILVSGDNRVEDYNEPQAMRDVLVMEFGIPEEDIAVDFAGRRTFDTCVRAHDLWGVQRAILVTQAFHLPRAVWTCRALGIEAYGVSATLRPYVRDEYYELREIAALNKAVFDVFIWTPSYVRGSLETGLDGAH